MKVNLKRSGCILVISMLCLQLAACGSTEQTQTTDTEAYAAGESAVNKNGDKESESASETLTGVAADGEQSEEQSGQDDSSEVTGRTGMTLDELLIVWDWEGLQPVYLEQVLADLEGCNIRYEGYYNMSGERLDVTLEDGTTLIFLETTRPVEVMSENDSAYGDGQYELIMKGSEFNADSFQENYLHCYDVIIDEYFWPDLSAEVITEDVLYSLNQTDLSIVRNQLFAKYGRKFKDTFLDAVFREKSWYDPRYEGAEFDANMQKQLNDIEQKNLQTVMKVEEMRKYRKTSGESYEAAKILLSGSWIDLDDDGDLEQVTYSLEQQQGEEYGEAFITVKEETSDTAAKAGTDGFHLEQNCHVLSMTDGSKLIVIGAEGMSADYTAQFYRYAQGELVDLGVIPADVCEVKAAGQTLTAPVETVHIQCEPLNFEYMIQNNALVLQEKSYYEYCGNNVTVLKALNLYSEQGAAKATDTLENGEEICILGGDLKEWVQIELTATGEKGWIKAKDSQCELSDGTMEISGLCLDGLTFYG